MKNATAIKSKWISFPAVAKSEIPSTLPSPQIVEPPPLPPEPSVQTLRNLTKITNFEKDIIMNTDTHNTLLQERIDMLTQQAAENQETINSLLSRIASFATVTEEQEPVSTLPMKYMETEALLGQISANTADEYLRNNPMLLEAFLNQGYSDRISDLVKHLSPKTRKPFVKHLISQLHRFSLIFSSFTILSKLKGENDFSAVLTKCIQNLYNTPQSFLFMKDFTTGEIGCLLPNDVLINVNDENSLIPSTKETTIIKTPSKAKNYSKTVDKMFNPQDKTTIIIPISNVASMMSIHTDNASPPYKNEDISVGDIFATLIEPLIKTHQSTESTLQRQQDKQRIDDFEHELLKKDYLETLLPFITTNLKDLIHAQEIRIFFISDKKFIYPHMDNDHVVEDKLEMKGIAKYIYRTKQYILEQILLSKYCDEEMDNWCINKSFLGLPLEDPDGTCNAVLCASSVGDYTFTEEDLETLLIISSSLALATQRSSENRRLQALETFIYDATRLPDILKKATDDIDELFQMLYQALNVDSLSIYESFTETLEDVKLIHCCGVKNFSIDFAKNRMKEGKIVNTTIIQDLPDFEPIGHYDYRSIFACFVERNGHKVGVFCTNPLGKSKQLHDHHQFIVRCFTNIYFNMFELKKENDSANLSQTRCSALEAIVKIIKKYSTKIDLFSLLKDVNQLIKFEDSCLYVHDIEKQTLIPFFKNEEKQPKVKKTIVQNTKTEENIQRNTSTEQIEIKKIVFSRVETEEQNAIQKDSASASQENLTQNQTDVPNQNIENSPQSNDDNSQATENCDEEEEQQIRSAFIPFSDSDVVYQEILKQKNVFDCSDLISKSELSHTLEYKTVLCLPLTPEYFVIFYGTEIGDSLYTIENFMPSIRASADYLSMNDPEFIHILEVNKIAQLPHGDDNLELTKNIQELSLQDSIVFALDIFEEFHIDKEMARKIVSKASKLCQSSWSRSLECLQISAIFLKNTPKDTFHEKAVFAILVASLFWILIDDNDVSSSQTAFGTNPDFKVKLYRAAEVSRKAGVPITDIKFWKYLNGCFNPNPLKDYEDLVIFMEDNDEHKMLLASLLCHLSEYRRYFVPYEKESEIDKATTYSVMNEIILPIYEKVIRHIPSLVQYESHLKDLRDILQKREEENPETN